MKPLFPSSLVRAATFVFWFIVFVSVCGSVSAAAVENKMDVETGTFSVFEGEVVEVELEEGPEGGAIYLVRDRLGENVLRFYAHPYRTTVQLNSAIQSVRDVPAGSQGTMIYRTAVGDELPELMFVKVTSSFDS